MRAHLTGQGAFPQRPLCVVRTLDPKACVYEPLPSVRVQGPESYAHLLLPSLCAPHCPGQRIQRPAMDGHSVDGLLTLRQLRAASSLSEVGLSHGLP